MPAQNLSGEHSHGQAAVSPNQTSAYKCRDTHTGAQFTALKKNSTPPLDSLKEKKNCYFLAVHKRLV